jgi:hypothetical protein
MTSFVVHYRNLGHWDFVESDTGSRLFRLRGSGVRWFALDERPKRLLDKEFRSFTLTLAYITEELMHENLIPDGCGNNKLAEGNL